MGLRKTEATGVIGWVDQRLSIMDAWNTHLAQYWASKNFNIWYFFGSLALIVLI
ncbi:MAG TPA: cytochrome b, partial [Gammaproteobacteria bacterium]|nr:cytochrome b [Gammaproteobacteria bacterium]